MIKFINEPCPLCGYKQSKLVFLLDNDGFDQSTLYKEVQLYSCVNCGHVYNLITKDDLKGIKKYYDLEASQNNKNTPSKEADLPGSSSPLSLIRYKYLFNFIKPFLKNKEVRILDLGCATGGFLNYLLGNGYTNLSGIDIVKDYIKNVSNKKFFDIKKGNAEKIPFDDNSFDVVILDQVLEHVHNIQKAIKEIKRVLKIDGYLFIAVPNAEKYSKKMFFHFYWLLIKEHLHHFDLEHLKFFTSLNGFKFLKHKNCYTPIMTHEMELPNLMTGFKFLNKDKKTKPYFILKFLKSYINSYIYSCRGLELITKNKIIKTFQNHFKEIYFYGIGKEFFYLYSNIPELDDKKITGLIDSNKYKQDNFTFKNMRIHSSDILKTANKNSCVIVTAIMHYDKIKKHLEEIGYKGEIIKI